MTDSKTYNGWTNYETWAVKLWIDNEQSTQEHWLEQARFLASPEGLEIHKGRFPHADPKRISVYALDEQLKESFEEGNPLASEASLWSDLMSSVLGRVNWREIAENLMEDIKEV